MLTINGDKGEGGGQVLRSALTLSMCRQIPFRIIHIRKRRKRPGLQRQHLAAVQAAATLSRARTEGAEIDSQELTFEPDAINPGSYRIDIGSAGSTTLVAQTLLPALVLGSAPSSLSLIGGTHNLLAPPFEFFAQTFCPLINRMGAKISARLERPGFYPRGGGIMHLEIQPAAGLQPFELMERGKLQSLHALILLAHLPGHIALREKNMIMQMLGIGEKQVVIRSADDSPGPGNAVIITVECEHLTEVFTGYGERGVPAEKVAEGAVLEVQHYLAAGVPIGSYLADQLLIPLALAGGGAFITVKPSLHTTTNMEVIRHFTGIDLKATEVEPDKFLIGF